VTFNDVWVLKRENKYTLSCYHWKGFDLDPLNQLIYYNHQEEPTLSFC